MMETTNTLNSGMCRCCSSEGTFKDIKTKYHWMGEEEVYADMLNDCFDIKIHTPEDTDDGICEVCITQLRNAANFKKQVLHTEEQFKKRLQNKEIKNPIKLESVDDPMDSDHLSDPDFSAAEYEVPIKEEMEDKPKGKKRTAKATTSRGKKAKPEAESSKRDQQGTSIKIDVADKTCDEARTKCPVKTTIDLTSDEEKKPVRKRSKKSLEISEKAKTITEMAKHRENLEIVMRNSNATPTRGHRGLGYACYFCPEQYQEPAKLKSHTLESHRDFKHTPDTKPAPLNNYLVKLDITSLTCKICLDTFDKLNALLDHLRVDHDEAIHTDIDDYMLPFRFDSDPFKCVFCETEFHSLKVGIEHMNIHYRNFICEVCDAGYVNRASWRNHRRRHLYGDFPCEKCPQVFNSESKLKSHTRGVHLRKNKRSKCPYCGEYFICAITKGNHMVKTHGVAPTVARCNACDRTFSNYQNLRIHKKTYHLLERNYKCTDCEMKFKNSKSLRNHLLRHTGARDFKCDICSKAYGRKSTLTQHMRIHANDRKYKCGHCMMAFVQKCSLISHLHSKHNTRSPNLTN